jgi:iron complex outermembrane receptor protein
MSLPRLVAVVLLMMSGFALPGSLRAQEPALVRARVLTGTDPVAGARLVMDGRSATSDQDGVALLRASEGTKVLVVSKIGFEPDSTRLSLRTGMDTTIVVHLSESAVELEEVVVTSTRANRRIEDQPLRVEVLGREEVEEKLLMTPGDITMLLNETGGLRVQNTSPSLGGANVRVQGLRGRYTLVLSDGLPLYGQAGGLGLLQVPPMDLGQVEVIKGAASALYGSSAMGGVISLVSRHPADEREVLLNATTLGGADAVLWLSETLSREWGFTLLGGGHRQGRSDRDADGWTDVPGYERVVARPRIFFDNGKGQSFLATVGVTIEGREGGTMAGALAPDGTPFVEDLNTRRFDVGAVGRAALGQGLLLSGRASAMTQRHRHQFGDVGEPDRHGTAFGEAALSRGAERGVWVLGASLQGDFYRSRAFPAFEYTFAVPSIFAHAEYDVTGRFSGAGSIRLDAHDTYGTQVSPRISLLGKLGGSWTARASAGTGFFAPTPFTEETEVTGLARLNPPSGLLAEKARSASVDLGGAIGAVEVNITFFGSMIDRAVQLRDASGEPGLFELANANEPTRTYGTDAIVRWTRGPIHLTATYAYTRSTEVDPQLGARREVALTPRHAAGLVGIFEAEGQGRIGLEVYYTGRQALANNPYRASSRPYVVVGALAERRIGALRVFINLENITDVRQTKYDRLVLPARAPDGRWTTDAWAPLEGRVINGGVRVAF